MKFFIRNKIYKFIVVGLLLPSILLSTEFLSDRMKATLDENGKLKIESNYLTNYILRGYDGETKENKYINIISASDKKIDFDLVDIEWDGLFPKDINFKLPKDNWQPTNNDLTTDYSSTKWKNMQLNITGSGLFDIKIALQDPSVDGADLISTFLLNLVGLANTSMEAVGNSSKLTSQFNKTKFDKLRKLSESITGWKSQVKSFGTYVSISRISLEYIDALLKELKIDKDVDHYLSDYYRVSSSLITSIKQLEKLSGTIAFVNSEEENRLKGSLAERFKKIDMFKGISSTPNAIAKEIAKHYKSASSDSEKTKILMNGLMPLAELVNLYENLLNDKLKVKGISELEKKELNKKILFLKGGRAIIILASLIYGEDDLVELVRKNPEKIMDSLIEISKVALGEILKLDNLDTIAKVAYKKYVGTFGISKSSNYYNNINKIGKANVYMKAVALGAIVGNKLIPMVWDIVMSPYSMSSLIKDGKLNKFGLLKSKVAIFKESEFNGALVEVKTLTNTTGSQELTVALKEGQGIRIFVDAKQERLFENSVAPWIVSPSYTPRTVYDILITTPNSYANDYLCVRKIIGNTDFSVYSDAKVGSHNLISGQCGVGTLFGGDWYINSINPDKLDSKYKLYLFHNDITQDNLSSAFYIYHSNENKYITVSVTDINFKNTFYKIKLVPTLKNVTFTSDTSAVTSENLIVSFNNENIEASLEDPIASYSYDWGDGDTYTPPNGTLFGNITHTYSTAGDYTVTLTVITESGMSYTYSEDVSVKEKNEFPLTLDSTTSTNFNLSWTAPKGATKYKLCFSSIDEVSYESAQTCDSLIDGSFLSETTSTTLSFNGDSEGNLLQSKYDYYMRVVAYNDSDEVVGVSSEVTGKLKEENLDKKLTVSGTFSKNNNLTFLYNHNGTNCSLDFRDGTRVSLDSCTGKITHSFKKEWVYGVELKSDNEIIDTLSVTIANSDNNWIGFVSSLNSYMEDNEKTDDIIKDGRLYLAPSLSNQSYYWTNYRYIKPNILSSVSGDNFVLEARIKNPSSEGGISCYDPSFRVIGENGKQAWVTFMSAGCTYYSSIGAVDSYDSGGASSSVPTSDLSILGQDFSDWKTIKLEVKNQKVSAYYEGQKLYTKTYTGSVDKIYGIAQTFKGSGSMDWVKLYNGEGKLIYSEDFN